MISRDRAVELLHTYIKDEKMRNHCYAAEAVMRSLACRLKRDEDTWGIAGLLHDLDIELVKGDLEKHTKEAVRILQEQGVDADIVEAIKMHNEVAWGVERNTEFHYALASGETITGLIVATALVYPDKKLKNVKPQSVIKRMKEKAFAASVNRDTIKECEKLGLELNEFVEICVEAMKKISDRIGL